MKNKKFAILLCTLNGENFLREQLDSIANQSVEIIDVWASDDGSTDETLKILKSYQLMWSKGHFYILQGPRLGYASNFMSLAANQNIIADYYAFSDQDDIWHAEKLQHAANYINKQPRNIPTLFCSRTKLVSESGLPTGRQSTHFQSPPNFRNALVQSIAGGNTMVFNHDVKKIIHTTGELKVVSHDWWLYILVSGIGGSVIYDKSPTINYRQHDANHTGANVSLIAQVKRFFLLMGGRFKIWNNQNAIAIDRTKELFTYDNQQILNNFIAARTSPFFTTRLYYLFKSGVFRQSLLGNIALKLAVIIKKI